MNKLKAAAGALGLGLLATTGAGIYTEKKDAKLEEDLCQQIKAGAQLQLPDGVVLQGTDMKHVVYRCKLRGVDVDPKSAAKAMSNLPEGAIQDASLRMDIKRVLEK